MMCEPCAALHRIAGPHRRARRGGGRCTPTPARPRARAVLRPPKHGRTRTHTRTGQCTRHYASPPCRRVHTHIRVLHCQTCMTRHTSPQTRTTCLMPPAAMDMGGGPATYEMGPALTAGRMGPTPVDALCLAAEVGGGGGGAGQECVRREGRYPSPPPAPGRPAYAQPLSL